MEFFNTVMGKKFFSADVPSIARSLATIADNINKPKEYDLIQESELMSACRDGWTFVEQLQSGYILIERRKK
jgi:hypothetical protein